jgi:hypothetical protein
MFPDNPEINEMINELKASQEEGYAQNSQFSKKEKSRISHGSGDFKRSVPQSSAMPTIDNKTTQKTTTTTDKSTYLLTYR